MPILNFPQLFGQPNPSPYHTPPFFGGDITPMQEDSPIQPMQQTARLQNVLNTDPDWQGPPEQDNPLAGIAEPSPVDPNAFVPSTEAIDRFNQFLSTYPGLKKPGMMAKIVAGLVSWNDPKLGMEIVNQQPELDQWKAMLPPLEMAAREERMSNREGRLATSAQQRMDLNQKKLELQQFKATHPNHVFKVDRDGYYVAFDPQNPAVPIPTGIASKDLGPLEKAELELTNYGRKLEIAEPFKAADDARSANTQREIQQMREDAQRSLAELRAELQNTRDERRHQQILAAIEARGDQSRQTKGTPSYSDLNPKPGSAGAKESELDRQRRYKNNAQVLLASEPNLKSYVTVTPRGDVIVKPVGSGTFLGMGTGLTKAERDRIMKAVYGDDVPGRVSPAPLKTVSSHAPTAPTNTTPGFKPPPFVAPTTANPKIGDIKTFPNGKKGRYAGKDEKGEIWHLVK